MLRIRQIMDQQNLRLRDVAQLLNVSPQYVASIVNGKKNVSLQTLHSFAQCLGVSMPELFTGYKSPGCQCSTHASCPYCGNEITINKV